MLGFLDLWLSMYYRGPTLGYSFWVYYDILLIVCSIGNGIFAAKMLFEFYESVGNNANSIDAFHKRRLRDSSQADIIKDRPKRTWKQILSHIFGEKELTIYSLLNPSAANLKPKLSFELMIRACI